MLIIVGAVIVFAATIGGFMMAGGHPGVLLHASEFVVILGIPLGVLVIATPIHVIKEIVHKTKEALAGKTATKSDFFDLLKLLYELFMMGRRNGLIALEEHVMDPPKSALFQKYPTLLNNHERLHFLCIAGFVERLAPLHLLHKEGGWHRGVVLGLDGLAGQLTQISGAAQRVFEALVGLVHAHRPLHRNPLSRCAFDGELVRVHFTLQGAPARIERCAVESTSSQTRFTRFS